MTTFQTYDDVVFTKGPLGIESPRYIKYQEDGQGGSRPVEVASPLRESIGFLREYVSGKQDYSQESRNIPNFPDFRFQNRYAQESGGPLVGETLISGTPSFDMSVPDIPALGPETPASMRRQQLEMLMPGFSERARKAREKYRTILRGA